MSSILISIVSPVYNSERIINELLIQVKQSVLMITEEFEIILINDASTDGSWEEIKKESSKDRHVKGINLSRNFGQHYAITAGLQHASGSWIVVMDSDLQDRPEEIPKLYEKAMEGYDSVFAQRTNRRDTWMKRKLSKIFYIIFGYLTDTKQDPSVANFGIYHRRVINAILSMKDQIKYFPAMIQWVGFRKFYLPVKHNYRYAGNSNYDLKVLTRMAVENIISFSDKPLRLTIKFGFVISFLSFITNIIYFYMYFLGEIKVLGFTSIILSIWFLSGIIILILGILGLYIGKMFEKIKERPLYIICEKSNL